MRAAFLENPGTFTLREIDRPEVAPDEILVRAHTCGICSSELDMYEGKGNIDYPRFAGHEVSGVVEEVGSRVEDLEPGDRVALYAEGKGFADYITVPASWAVKLKAETRFDLALGEPIACAANGVRKVQPQLNDSVALVGCGFMGLMLLQMFRIAGAGHLIAIDTRASALELAKQLGATHAFNPKIDDVKTAVLDLTEGRGADIGVEGAGLQQTLDLTVSLVRMEGKLEVFGYHLGGQRSVDWAYWNWMAFQVINGHTRSPHIYVEGMRIGLGLLEAGKLDMDSLVTHRFPFEEINEGFSYAVAKPEGFVKGVVICN